MLDIICYVYFDFEQIYPYQICIVFKVIKEKKLQVA